MANIYLFHYIKIRLHMKYINILCSTSHVGHYKSVKNLVARLFMNHVGQFEFYMCFQQHYPRRNGKKKNVHTL